MSLSVLTPIAAKTFILDSLTSADECSKAVLAPVMDELWNLTIHSGCGGNTLMRLYLTKLRAIELLMSCGAYQMDVGNSQLNGSGSGKMEALQDLTQSNQHTGSSFRYSDTSSFGRYNDFAKARMDTKSQRDEKSCAREKGFSSSNDRGKGEGESSSDVTSDGNSYSNNSNVSRSAGFGAANSKARGCNWSYSTEKTKGAGGGKSESSGNSLLIVGAHGAASAGADSTVSTSKYAADTKDSSHSVSEDTRHGESVRTAGRTGYRTALRHSRSGDFFYNNANSESQSVSRGRNGAESSSHRDDYSHAAGAGDSFSKSDARSEQSTQGTMTLRETNTDDYSSERWMRSDSTSQKNSQRYYNLKRLHIIVADNLKYLRDRNNNNLQGAFGTACRTLDFRRADCEFELRKWDMQRSLNTCLVSYSLGGH